MTQARQNAVQVVDTTAYGESRSRGAPPNSRKASVRIYALQQLAEVFATSDLLTNAEREMCKRADDSAA